MYRIREVDGFDDVIADTLKDLHEQTFLEHAKVPDFTVGHWWIGWLGNEAVSFASLTSSDRYPRAGYFKRVGVLSKHRGHGLQLRHMRALEARARRNGWDRIISDTTDNLHSGNNFISAGYWMMKPENPWAFPSSVYWVKHL